MRYHLPPTGKGHPILDANAERHALSPAPDRNTDRALFWVLFAVGAMLRAVLFWRNPPKNVYDDHYLPIAKILATWQTPAKDACWECCQPPVFYWVSAFYARALQFFGISPDNLYRALQFLTLLFGIAWLFVAWAVIRRLRLSRWLQLALFALACLTPRMVYMSALHSNDTMSYVTIGLAMLAVLKLFSSEWSWRWAAVATVSILLAVFTKYTALALGPAFGLAWLLAVRQTVGEQRRHVLLVGASVLAITGAAVVAEFASNQRQYGQFVPEGPDIIGYEIRQPPGDDLSFFDFRLWTVLSEPILTPRNIAAFWPQLHGRVWFDLEPKFLYLSDPDGDFWSGYYAYLEGETDRFPGALPLSPLSRLSGTLLIALGLALPALLAMGAWRVVHGLRADGAVAGLGSVPWVFFLALMAGNVVALIHYAHRYPFYSHMKVSYLMGTWPIALLLAGVVLSRWSDRARRPAWTFVSVVGIVVAAHILYVAAST